MEAVGLSLMGLSILPFPSLLSEMYARDAWPGLLLSHPVSQHVCAATLNHSARHKLTDPSLTAAEINFDD